MTSLSRLRDRRAWQALSGTAGLIAAALCLAAPVAHADDKDARADAACAAMGEGFKRVPGSNTCVQISGSVGITVGTGRSLVNAPNQGFSGTPTPPSSPTGSDNTWMRTR
ncbi:hypothetical protein GCM10007301_10830 [Azorhizobium oxalatiphilum]|uniref:Porin n=1 Tax=Azorhizobium oxalatiphilum TaxID=980631 RepID=A0A917F7D4_9HYPH|nr:hypothetical protein [Azorhizobium oxalatiphilum]GGF53206.1 hypothetical protein GCM10007301_10830 [Azorhizobium oxalatiphilum]